MYIQKICVIIDESLYYLGVSGVSKTVSNSSARNRKMSIRLTEDEYDRLDYYAEKWGKTKTDVILEGFEHYIRWVNSDYDLPTAEIQRLNQLIDVINRLVVSQENLEKSTISGIESIIGFVRGENYLSDLDEEEL